MECGRRRLQFAFQLFSCRDIKMVDGNPGRDCLVKPGNLHLEPAFVFRGMAWIFQGEEVFFSGHDREDSGGRLQGSFRMRPPGLFTNLQVALSQEIADCAVGFA